MKILFNPLDGAAIKNVWYKDICYFKYKDGDGDVWDTATLRQFDNDEEADFFSSLFGFLEGVTVDKAAKILEESKNSYPCKEPGCTFVTNVPVKLASHVKEHKKEKELSTLGIPRVRTGNASSDLSETAREREFESNNVKEGLTEGEGLVRENPPTAIMS